MKICHEQDPGFFHIGDTSIYLGGGMGRTHARTRWVGGWVGRERERDVYISYFRFPWNSWAVDRGLWEEKKKKRRRGGVD